MFDFRHKNNLAGKRIVISTTTNLRQKICPFRQKHRKWAIFFRFTQLQNCPCGRTLTRQLPTQLPPGVRMHSFSGRTLTRQLPTQLPPGVRMHSFSGRKLEKAFFDGTIFYSYALDDCESLSIPYMTENSNYFYFKNFKTTTHTLYNLIHKLIFFKYSM